MIYLPVIYTSMTSMKIAMIGQKGMPAKHGGVEQHVHGLATGLVKAGHAVTVYSRSWYTGETGDTKHDGVDVKHVGSIRTKHLDTISHTLLATLNAIRNKYDVIHYHGIGPSLLSWIPRVFSPHSKVVTTFHSIDRYHEKWNWFAKTCLRFSERTACAFAHETISVSRSLQQYCLNEFQTHTAYIPNAVSTADTITTQSHLASFGLAPQTYLVMVSRLVKHKGAHLLIKAFAHLKEKYKHDEKIKNLKLAIVGGSVYTDTYVRELHKSAGACNDIVFTDFQTGEALEELYKNAKVLVHPSLNEGLPVTVLQAMSYNVPVLVSDIPEHLEIIKDVRVLFNENNIEAIEKAIMQFLSMPKETVEEITTLHRQMIERNYSWDGVVPQVIELYARKQNIAAPAMEQV